MGAAAPQPDVALLDLGRPRTTAADDALLLCRQLRGACPETVVVLLGQGADEADGDLGVAHGAGDYVTDGSDSRVVVARVGALLRPAQLRAPLRWGDLELDVHARRCRIRGRTVRLRPLEFVLLERLASSAGSVVPWAAFVA